MIEKTAIETDGAPQTDNPYSQAIEVDGLLFVSGFAPVDPETMEMVSGSIPDQTERVMENVRAVIEEAGGSMEDIVKATVYLADMDDYDEMNAKYAEYVGETPPARVCIEAARLPEDATVEIDAIAKLE